MLLDSEEELEQDLVTFESDHSTSVISLSHSSASDNSLGSDISLVNVKVIYSRSESIFTNTTLHFGA